MRPREAELFKDKVEVSLDGRQIFYLFFGGAVIACLVFVLGVMVGKRVEARSHVHAQAATSAAEDPLAALDKLSADADDLAFPEALTGDANKPLGPVDQVLQAPVDDTLVKPDASDVVAKKVEPEAAKAEPKPAKPEPEPAAAAKPEKPEPKPEPDNKDSADRSWTLQLSSFQERAEADSFYSQLIAAGYSPYIVEAEVAGKGTWYRVRLGKYDSYDAAIKAKREFESKQQIIAYVTRIKR